MWRNAKGQVTIAVGILMLTLMFLLAFAVNIGMLVHAKINLQNAADLAAYAGASTQARQLNAISFLNYEMRRQYKKLLFRNYVLGNLAQPTFPRTPGGRTPYAFRANASATPYGAPTICITFNRRDNYCQVSTLRAISIPTANPIDSLTSVLSAQLSEIERARQISCVNIGRMNEMLASYWLYNTDPTLENMAQLLQTGATNVPELRGALTTLRGLAQGLGIGPKLFMLRRRIKTLEGYLNIEPKTDVELGTVEQLKSGPLAAKHERTIQAYLSAYHTLGEHLFEADTIRMTELSQSPQLILEELRSGFSLFPVGMQFGTGGAAAATVAAGAGARDCSQYPIPYAIRNLPLGVWKSPRALTYYAVRLTAKARLIFNPFGGDLELSAYSAAQPFGSRIGPKLEEPMFTYETIVQSAALGTSPGSSRGVNNPETMRSPGLAIAPGDGPNSWGLMSTLGAYQQAMSEATDPNSPMTFQAIKTGIAAAMAPTPWEVGRYNIPGDVLDSDPFTQYFAPASQLHAIWAPLYEPGGGADVDTLIQEVLNELNAIEPQNMSIDQKTRFKDALQQAFRQYLGQLAQGRGEDGESINFYKMTNPFAQPAAAASGQPPIPLHISEDVATLDPLKTKSSWGDVKNTAYKEQKRTGYSVKFVSFKTLLNPDGVSANTEGGAWENRPIEDAQAEADYQHLQH